MGYVKRMLEEGPASSADGLYVCSGCIEEYALQEVIAGNAVDEECDFCTDRAADEPVAPLRAVIDRMHECLPREYGRAVEQLSYETAEGGYQGITWDTWDLVGDQLGLDLPRDVSGRLFQSIADGLGDETWCEADVALLPESQVLLQSWRMLCELVKHGRRYFFLHHQYDVEDHDPQPPLNPSEILKRVCDIAERESLVRTINPGTVLYRARAQKPGQLLRTVEALGPPPDQVAGANRMSPAGVPLRYCCLASETTVREIANEPGILAVGRFETQRSLQGWTGGSGAALRLP
jgi:hypothetical protein